MLNIPKHRILVDEETGIERIEFFSEHWYKLPDGTWVKSVTGKIGEILSKGPQFNQYLMDTGNESKFIVREAQDSGSRVHNAIEQLIYGNEIGVVGETENYTEREWKLIQAWKAWWAWLVENHDAKPLAIEAMVYSLDWETAGTLDLVVEIDGEVWIIDWKTGKAIYPYENGIQLGAYYRMWNQFNPEIKATRMAVVHVGAANKTFVDKTLSGPRIKVEEIDNIAWAIEDFNSIVKMHKRRFPTQKCPVLQYDTTLKLEAGTLEKG